MDFFRKLKDRLANKEDDAPPPPGPSPPSAGGPAVWADQECRLPDGIASAIAYDPHHGLVAYTIADGVSVHSPTGVVVHVPLPMDATARHLCFVSGQPGRLVVGAGAQLLLVDVEARAVLLDHSPEGGDAVAVLCNASGSPFVLCAFASGALLALDAAAAAVSRHALGRLEGPPTALACHPADEALLVAQVPAGLTTLCGLKGTALGMYQAGEGHGRCSSGFCFTPDGKYLLASDDQGVLLVWLASLGRKKAAGPPLLPRLAFPMPFGPTPLLSPTAAPGVLPSECIVLGCIAGLGVLRVRLAEERQEPQCAAIDCVVALDAYSPLRQVVFLRGPSPSEPFPAVLLLPQDGSVHLVGLTPHARPAALTLQRAVGADVVEQCLALPLTTVEGCVPPNAVEWWPGWDADAFAPLRTVLLLNRTRTGALLPAWISPTTTRVMSGAELYPSLKALLLGPTTSPLLPALAEVGGGQEALALHLCEGNHCVLWASGGPSTPTDAPAVTSVVTSPEANPAPPADSEASDAPPTPSPPEVGPGPFAPALGAACVGLALDTERAARAVVAFGDRRVVVLTLPRLQRHDVDLVELVEADVIRQVAHVSASLREDGIKAARRQLLEAVYGSRLASVDIAVALSSESEGASSPSEASPLPVLLAVTDRGVVYAIAYANPDDVYIIANHSLGTAPPSHATSSAPSTPSAVPAFAAVRCLRPACRPTPAPAAPGTLLLNAPAAAPQPLPSSLCLNLSFDRHVLPRAKGVLEGALCGPLSQRLLWWRLTLRPDEPPHLRLGHCRLDSEHEFMVEVAGLPDELASLEDDDPLLMSISHDTTLGFYIVSLGATTLLKEQYEGATGTDLAVTHVELRHQPLPGPMDPTDEDVVHLPLFSPTTCLYLVEVADGYTQDVCLQCSEEYSGPPSPPADSDRCVAGHGRRLAALALPALTPLAAAEVPAELREVAVAAADGVWCAVALLGDGAVWVYDVGTLVPRTTLRHPFAGRPVRLAASPQLMGCSLLLAAGDGSGLVHWRLRADSEGEAIPTDPALAPAPVLASPPSLRDRVVVEIPAASPPPRKGLLDGVFGPDGGPTAQFHRLLTASTPPRPPGSPASSAPASSGAAATAAAREELLGKHAASPPPATEAGRAEGGLRDTRRVMAENQRRLQERGEKLGNMADKSEQMSHAARGFADMARELRRREENKKWWEL